MKEGWKELVLDSEILNSALHLFRATVARIQTKYSYKLRINWEHNQIPETCSAHIFCHFRLLLYCTTLNERNIF